VHRITIKLHNKLYVHSVCPTKFTNDKFQNSTGAETCRNISNVCGTYWVHVKLVIQIN